MAVLAVQQDLEDVLKVRQVKPSDIPWEEGILRWISKQGNTFEVPGWAQAALSYSLHTDRTLQVQLQRGNMETNAENSHIGEERWCNAD